MKLSIVKSLVPLAVKKRLAPYLRGRRITLPNGPRSFLFLAADYGNIGDLGITAAQAVFLRSQAPARAVVIVPISKTLELIRSIRKQILPGDVISIVGGGNMGSLYPDIEALRQLVIQSFPRNRIVCFPQTLDWSSSRESEKALTRIATVYSQHPDLHIFARESVTQKKLETVFRAKPNVHVGFAPDIVLSVTAFQLGSSVDTEPSGILLCLRDDRECALNGNQRTELETLLAHTGHRMEFTDTHAGGVGLNDDQGAQLLAEKINQFSAARLVVTDRLHGMILSVIAGTPCLVLPNSNHKIQQTWKDWLQDLPQVRFALPGDIDAIRAALSDLLVVPRRNAESTSVPTQNYESLRQAIAQS